MKRIGTEIEGAYFIEWEPQTDQRGFFARTFCTQTFAEWGLSPSLSQCSVSYNAKKGTLRGLHWQKAPHEEAKLVRCTRGVIFDVIVDMRRDSKSYLKWRSFTLGQETPGAIYIPEGVAHGFQTLQDGCEVVYQMSVPYHGESACIWPHDDPRLAIPWPISEKIMSDKDKGAIRWL